MASEPEQHVSDRLAEIKRHFRDLWEPSWDETIWLAKQLSDYRQAALSSDAALEQADLQIQALQAEQARLRAENERLRARNTALDQVRDAVQELIDSSGKRVYGEDLQAALDRLPEATATKPLHAETEQEVDGRWIAEITEIPGALAYGQTEDQAVERASVIARRVMARQDEGDGLKQAGWQPIESITDEQLSEMWRSVQGPLAGLTGPLIRFAGLVGAEYRRTAWQPIATAPQDGTRVLLTRKQSMSGEFVVVSGHWNSGGAFNMPHWSTTAVMHNPSHWMPLPEAPST